MNLQQPEYAVLFPESLPLGRKAGFALRRFGSLVLGQRMVPARALLRSVTAETYRDLLEATRGLHLYRIWNQVPGINEVPLDTGLERYRDFSAGRADAFEQFYGAGFTARLPAASAVGTESDDLSIAFVAGSAAPKHCENPEQMPAYLYPAEHGPRSPSFARATCAEADGRRLIFVSGTAAIKGHATVSEDSLERQIECTLDNLRLISTVAGIGSDLGRGKWRRALRVYLRPGEDRRTAEAAVGSRLLAAGDAVEWRQADLCRSALKIEIEVSLIS